MLTYDEDFAGFCRNATDDQLKHILEKEYDGAQYDADREACYWAAVIVATERGWTVNKGVRK